MSVHDGHEDALKYKVVAVTGMVWLAMAEVNRALDLFGDVGGMWKCGRESMKKERDERLLDPVMRYRVLGHSHG